MSIPFRRRFSLKDGSAAADQSHTRQFSLACLVASDAESALDRKSADWTRRPITGRLSARPDGVYGQAVAASRWCRQKRAPK
jgi:hypothetical protein